LIDRRKARRFLVDWPVRVERDDGKGGMFVESGLLQNISSSGALLSLTKTPPNGARVDVYINLPTKGTRWMKYPARVLRIEGDSAAIKFDTTRPDFDVPLVRM